MTGITFLKNLKNESVTLLQLLNSYVFGDKQIRPYDESVTYHTGDMILITNEESGKIEIYQATTDNMSGPFDPNAWSNAVVSDVVSNSVDEVVMISPIQPTSKNNFVWYQPLQYKTGTLPEIEVENIEELVSIFSMDAFPIVDEMVPENEEVGLFFDIEGMSDATTDMTEEQFSDSTVKHLDESDDVVISDEPSYDHETIIWGDTDLTDNI